MRATACIPLATAHPACRRLLPTALGWCGDPITPVGFTSGAVYQSLQQQHAPQQPTVFSTSSMSAPWDYIGPIAVCYHRAYSVGWMVNGENKRNLNLLMEIEHGAG